MPEWDAVENYISSRGYVTVYSPQYDNELEDHVMSFDARVMDLYLKSISYCFEEALLQSEENGDAEAEEYDLVGINSNSFTSDKNHHNIFLEWDDCQHLPDINTLKSIGGTLVKTDGGFHILKTADISWQELQELQEIYNCCNGFRHYSDIRKSSCLRVCPKGNNRLEVIQKEDSFLYSIYEQLVNRLEEVYNVLVRY